MDVENYQKAKELRALGSEKAADWFLTTHPYCELTNWSPIINLLPHISWALSLIHI